MLPLSKLKDNCSSKERFIVNNSAVPRGQVVAGGAEDALVQNRPGKRKLHERAANNGDDDD
eukprot:5256043-Pleurochrysis_carterae.AAC.1